MSNHSHNSSITELLTQLLIMNMSLRWAREGKIWCCIVLYFEAGFEGIQNKVSFRGEGEGQFM